MCAARVETAAALEEVASQQQHTIWGLQTEQSLSLMLSKQPSTSSELQGNSIPSLLQGSSLLSLRQSISEQPVKARSLLQQQGLPQALERFESSTESITSGSSLSFHAQQSLKHTSSVRQKAEKAAAKAVERAADKALERAAARQAETEAMHRQQIQQLEEKHKGKISDLEQLHKLALDKQV